MTLLCKACKRCGGDLVREGDEYLCLQCGRRSMAVDNVQIDLESMESVEDMITGEE